MITPRLGLLYRALLTSAASISLLSMSVQAQALLSHYTLNGCATDTGSFGVNGTLAGRADYGASGSGVGAFDRALSTGGGANDYFTAATGGRDAFGADALTITMWVKIESASTGDRLVSNITGTSGFDLVVNSHGASGDRFGLVFAINGTSGGSGVMSPKGLHPIDKWLFIAVTYDSAQVRFYSGDESTGTVLNHTVAKTGRIAASTAALEIGGTPATTTDRSPKALFNDVRIYSGKLSLSELEALRAATLIPEPSNYLSIHGTASHDSVALR